MDRGEASRRVLQICGEGDRHARDLVAKALIAVPPERHRAESHDRLLWKIAVGDQTLAKTRRHEFEQYGIHRDVKMFLGIPQWTEWDTGEGKRPLATELPIEGEARDRGSRQLGGRIQRAAQTALQSTPRVNSKGPRTTKTVGQSISPHLPERRASGLRLLGLVGNLQVADRLGTEIHQDLAQPNPRLTIHQAMVNLQQCRDALFLETFDPPTLPERTGSIERLGVKKSRQFGERRAVSGLRKGHATDVIRHIEVLVLDPVRAIEPKGRFKQLPLEPRNEFDPLLQDFEVALEAKLRTTRRI